MNIFFVASLLIITLAATTEEGFHSTRIEGGMLAMAAEQFLFYPGVDNFYTTEKSRTVFSVSRQNDKSGWYIVLSKPSSKGIMYERVSPMFQDGQRMLVNSLRSGNETYVVFTKRYEGDVGDLDSFSLLYIVRDDASLLGCVMLHNQPEIRLENDGVVSLSDGTVTYNFSSKDRVPKCNVP